MVKSGEIHDHKKSGQLRQRGRNRFKTEPMMMMMEPSSLLVVAAKPVETHQTESFCVGEV